MIVRIMGEGQVRLADSHLTELNKLDDELLAEMENGDGPGFRRTLQALLTKVREHMPDLKVIFVSGYAEENVRQDIADNQSVEFLPKPYSLDQINTKVKDVLGKVTE